MHMKTANLPLLVPGLLQILCSGQLDTITGIINVVYLDWTVSVETGMVIWRDKLNV